MRNKDHWVAVPNTGFKEYIYFPEKMYLIYTMVTSHTMFMNYLMLLSIGLPTALVRFQDIRRRTGCYDNPVFLDFLASSGFVYQIYTDL